jgi:hypothetical protein
MNEKKPDFDHPPRILEATEKDIRVKKPPNDKIISFNIVNDKPEF